MRFSRSLRSVGERKCGSDRKTRSRGRKQPSNSRFSVWMMYSSRLAYLICAVVVVVSGGGDKDLRLRSDVSFEFSRSGLDSESKHSSFRMACLSLLVLCAIVSWCAE